MDTESVIDLKDVKNKFLEDIKKSSDKKLLGLKETIESHFLDVQNLVKEDKFRIFDGSNKFDNLDNFKKMYMEL